LRLCGSALFDRSPQYLLIPHRTILGCDGVVEIDEESRSVTKTYLHPDRNIAVRNVRREVEYASRFLQALAGVGGVACPRVIAWELSRPPRVVMELCPGRELSDFLLRIDGRDPRIADISSRIQTGLEVYTRLFGEPYYDFCFNNMLFDEDSRTVTFLDFVIPEQPVNNSLGSPLEVSLGWLVGCACYTLSRPAFLFSSKAASLGVAQTVLAGFDGRVDSGRIYAFARGVFSQMCKSGGRLRKNYYRTVGALVTRSCLQRLQRRAASSRPTDTTLLSG